MQMKQKALSWNNCSFLGNESLQIQIKIMKWSLSLSSSLTVNDFSNKKLKKLYPDLNFISHFIRNNSDLKLKTSFLKCGTILYEENESPGR